MSEKLAILDIPRMRVFLNRVYNVIVSAYDAINKLFSRDSNYAWHVDI